MSKHSITYLLKTTTVIVYYRHVGKEYLVVGLKKMVRGKAYLLLGFNAIVKAVGSNGRSLEKKWHDKIHL